MRQLKRSRIPVGVTRVGYVDLINVSFNVRHTASKGTKKKESL